MQLPSNIDTSPHAKRWTRISEEQGRKELKSVSTTAFARRQPCFLDSHVHCLMVGRFTPMTRCANFRVGFKTKVASRNHYHPYIPFPYNSLFLLAVNPANIYGEQFYGCRIFCVLAANCKSGPISCSITAEWNWFQRTVCEWCVWRVKYRNPSETFSVGSCQFYDISAST